MRFLRFAWVIVALAVAYLFVQRVPLPSRQEQAAVPVPQASAPELKGAKMSAPEKDQDRVEADYASLPEQPAGSPSEQSTGSLAGHAPGSLADQSLESSPPKEDFSYLADYAYSEIPPDAKPADTVLESLKAVPVGTPLEEIKRAAAALGLDYIFMKAVAKIESDFDPKQRTGSYIGLFQLSNYEFVKYGSGEITSPRDNAIAAAYKFIIEATLFELATHQKANNFYRYLIHQQGSQGAAEHVSHPERVAWKSMCATDEGREKGERWCKRAIWQNTLPAIKQVWKSVDNLPSGAFVDMWHQRVDLFYSRYSETLAPN